jgi:DnaJ-class molecular chaperone
MKDRVRKIPDPLLRILVVFVLLIGGFLVVRFLLPPSFKDRTQHVKLTIEREMALPVRYAGSGPCAECHEEAKVKQTGYHRTLSCETCHGAAKAHADNPTDVKPVAPRKREFCSLCHHFDMSRPTGFPQINPVAHNPMKPCISCHNPHDPKPPTVPQECQACHAEIARTKSLSPHALLECTTCHTVPVEHKVTPRATMSSIPTNREFCGRCHGKGSAEVGPPKVDLATHGEKYLCWQCHYPHMPEVK